VRHNLFFEMAKRFNSMASLKNDLRTLGVRAGDGLFVHASMHAMGPTTGDGVVCNGLDQQSKHHERRQTLTIPTVRFPA